MRRALNIARRSLLVIWLLALLTLVLAFGKPEDLA